MSQYTTRKSSKAGKAETLRRKAIRAERYAVSVIL